MKNNSTIKLMISMLIWGSLGVFVKNINLPSQEIAFSRAVIGTIFIFFVNKFYFKNSLSELFDRKNRRTLFVLIALGIFLGLNWILLFQSYKYTTIANGTLTYYLAPALAILLAPFIIKERIKLKSIISVIIAIFGLFLILTSNNTNQTGEYNHFLGISFALLAALVYALIILINKKVQGVNGLNSTFIQMFVSAVSLLPIILYRGEYTITSTKTLVYLLVVGIIHTGLAYILYFTSLKSLATEKIAILSYIDPVSSVIYGFLLLGEGVSIKTIIGGILILSTGIINMDKE
ncbi:DMT family transporter [Clostridium paridis]|uniref:EamA family transporter n=1 Tax=Clostridium paridis TaxID=2803863 RepID=A0A937K5X1_9CLOT|nr:EamA family transporter [Clostridium paridis]MBL4932880.1 EamA family transporter [Clostridium paridis]